MLEVLGGALRARGHSVAFAPDGASALEAADRRSFDAVVCDVHLPNLDGLAVLKGVRSRSPDTAVILMTGHGGVKEAVTALHEGAVDYLTKPFAVGQLLARLDEVAQHNRSNEESGVARPPPNLSLVPPSVSAPVAGSAPLMPLHEAMCRYEKDYLRQALTLGAGKKAATAMMLGISRKSLWEKLKRYALEDARNEAGESEPEPKADQKPEG